MAVVTAYTIRIYVYKLKIVWALREVINKLSFPIFKSKMRIISVTRPLIKIEFIKFDFYEIKQILYWLCLF